MRVGWEIDIEARTPREAARKALRIQRDPESIATVFDVHHKGKKFVVDLSGVERVRMRRLGPCRPG